MVSEENDENIVDRVSASRIENQMDTDNGIDKAIEVEDTA